eukprot:1956089-Rhodomonas_salina.1
MAYSRSIFFCFQCWPLWVPSAKLGTPYYFPGYLFPARNQRQKHRLPGPKCTAPAVYCLRLRPAPHYGSTFRDRSSGPFGPACATRSGGAWAGGRGSVRRP